MAKPILVGDLRTTLKKLYTEDQLKELDEVLAGCGIDMEASQHLEIIPESNMRHALNELAKEMSGLGGIPWYLSVKEQALLDSCFYKVKVFEKYFWFHSSFNRPAVKQVHITANGVQTGGVMVDS